MVLRVVDANLLPRVRQRREVNKPPTAAAPSPPSASAAPPRASAVQPAVRIGTEKKGLSDREKAVPRPGIGLNTLRRFQQAHQDTPDKLRALEEGWRARRRISLSPDAPIPPLSVGPKPSPILYDPSSLPQRDRTSRPTRRTVSFANTPTAPAALAEKHLPAGPSIPRQSRPQPATETLVIAHCPPATAPTTSHAGRVPAVSPILAHPLPSTPIPQPITSRSSETMYVPSDGPSRKYELILRLEHRDVFIRKGGEEIIIRPSYTSTLTTPSKRPYRVLRLCDTSIWRKREYDEWEAVERLVQGTKRKTPRVKIYHPFGNICVTCSSPPDVILSFATSSSSGSTARSDGNVKVRINYSRLAKEIRIDTSSSTSVRCGEKGESFRTRRIVPLQGEFNDISQTNDDNAGLNGNIGIPEAAVKAWRLDGTAMWRPEEQEAVRRLWLSRKDWSGFG